MEIVTLNRERTGEAVDVLCDAFADYPVMRFVIGPAGAAYQARLRALITFFTTARFLNGDVVLGACSPEGLVGVANITRPGGTSTSPALEPLREALWREVGAASRARYEALGRVWQTFAVSRAHYHLNAIGVRRAVHRRGAGRLLLDALHAMSARSEDSCGVSLTTEDPANVPLYEHFGYRIVGCERVLSELETWGLFREDPSVSA